VTADGRSTQRPVSWSGHRVSSRRCGHDVCPVTFTGAASFFERRRITRRPVPLSESHSRVEGRRHRQVSSVRDPGDNASGTSSARVLSTITATTCHNTWPRSVTQGGARYAVASGLRWLVRSLSGRHRATPRDGWPVRDGGRHPVRRAYGRRPGAGAGACSAVEGTRRTPCSACAVGVTCTVSSFLHRLHTCDNLMWGRVLGSSDADVWLPLSDQHRNYETTCSNYETVRRNDETLQLCREDGDAGVIN